MKRRCLIYETSSFLYDFVTVLCKLKAKRAEIADEQLPLIDHATLF